MNTPQMPATSESHIAKLEHEARTDDDARSILSDFYESIGRHDVAMLHRDQLPKRGRTRRRVESMNDAERAKMAGWAERWIKVGLSTERADRPLFEAAVAACYRYTGLAAPKTIVWAPCPIVVAYAGSIASAWLKANGVCTSASVGTSVGCDSVHASVRRSVGNLVGRSVYTSVNDSVGRSVHASVSDSVGASVDDSVGRSVGRSVGDSVGRSVGDSVHESVSDSMRASVGNLVGTSVYTSVHESVSDSVRRSVSASVGHSVGTSVYTSVHESINASVSASVGASVGHSVYSSVSDSLKSVTNKTALDQWHLYQGGSFWVGGWYWGSPSYVSFMLDVLRLDIGREQELKARAYAATHESACWWYPTNSFVIVSERPTVIEKHANGKLKLARWDWVDAGGKACSWEVAP